MSPSATNGLLPVRALRITTTRFEEGLAFVDSYTATSRTRRSFKKKGPAARACRHSYIRVNTGSCSASHPQLIVWVTAPGFGSIQLASDESRPFNLRDVDPPGSSATEPWTKMARQQAAIGTTTRLTSGSPKPRAYCTRVISSTWRRWGKQHARYMQP